MVWFVKNISLIALELAVLHQKMPKRAINQGQADQFDQIQINPRCWVQQMPLPLLLSFHRMNKIIMKLQTNQISQAGPQTNINLPYNSKIAVQLEN